MLILISFALSPHPVKWVNYDPSVHEINVEWEEVLDTDEYELNYRDEVSPQYTLILLLGRCCHTYIFGCQSWAHWSNSMPKRCRRKFIRRIFESAKHDRNLVRRKCSCYDALRKCTR